MWGINSFKIIILTLKYTINLFGSILSIKTTFKLMITFKSFDFAMDQWTFRNFYRFLSKLSDINHEPFFLGIFFWILIFLLILFWLIIIDRPLNFNLHIFLIIVSKNTKSKEVNISQRLEGNCIPSCLLQEKVVIKLNEFESHPFNWFLIQVFL
jgi:hypothetical protein